MNTTDSAAPALQPAPTFVPFTQRDDDGVDASMHHFYHFMQAITLGLLGEILVEIRIPGAPQKYGSDKVEYGFFLVSADRGTWKKPWEAIKNVLDRGPKLRPPGVYCSVNPILRDLLAHANHELKIAKWAGNKNSTGAAKPEATTSACDDHILVRRFLPLDIDPVRRAGDSILRGVCATAGEKAAAEAVARAVGLDLAARGWPKPMALDTGNGIALWYPIDLPADDGGLVGRAIKALAQQHSSADAEVDVSVFNRARIMRVPGTWNGKGSDAPEVGRPHRMCRILATQSERREVPRELIEALAAEYCDPKVRAPKPAPAAKAKGVAAPHHKRGARPPGAGRPADAVTRCRAFVAPVEPAIEGEHGSDATYRVARIIFADFGLDEAAGYPLLEEYSARCSPPWTDKELRHKWESAVAAGDPPEGRGHKLAEARSHSPDESHPTPAAADPLPTGGGGGAVPLGDGADDTSDADGASDPDDPEAPAEGTAGAAKKRRRKRIYVSDNNENETRTEILAELATFALTLYQCEDRLVELVRDDRTRELKITPLDTAGVRTLITEHCDIIGEVGEEVKSMHPPAWLPRAVESRPPWPGIRPLVGVTAAPILRPDGSLCQSKGYDPVSGLYYEPNCAYDPIPANPTHEDARAAVERLSSGVRQFPFASDIDRIAWVAWTVTIAARPAITGPVPLFGATANAAGSGKSALASAAAIIATGGDPPMSTYPTSGTERSPAEDEPELRKLAVSCAMAGHQAFILDNVPTGHAFGSGTLNAIITMTANAGRALGTNSAPVRPSRTVLGVTGNNIRPIADMVRRVVMIRLCDPSEKPEERPYDGPEVCEWARANRGTLLPAALTIVVAYIRAGKPNQNLPKLGSFEGWSDLVRSALVWAGYADCRASAAQYAAEDPDRLAVAALIELLETASPCGAAVTAQEVVKAVHDDLQRRRAGREKAAGTPEPDAGKGSEPAKPFTLADLDAVEPAAGSVAGAYRRALPKALHPDATMLGKLLSRYRDKTVGGKCIKSEDLTRGKVALWSVRTVPAAASPAPKPPLDSPPVADELLRGCSEPPPPHHPLSTPAPPHPEGGTAPESPIPDAESAGVRGCCGGDGSEHPRTLSADTEISCDEVRGLRGWFATADACAENAPEGTFTPPEDAPNSDKDQNSDFTPATPANARLNDSDDPPEPGEGDDDLIGLEG